MSLLKGLQVSLARLNDMLLVSVPVALEITDVLFLLLKQFVHFDIVLGQDGTTSLVVLLVTQLLDLRLGLFSVYLHPTTHKRC